MSLQIELAKMGGPGVKYFTEVRAKGMKSAVKRSVLHLYRSRWM